MSDNARDSSSAKQSGGHYPEVDPQPNFPALEREILEVWRRDETFRRSLFLSDGDLSVFVSRPGAAILLVLNIGLILSQLPVAKRAFSRLKGHSV